jgi:hypothetical protein
LKPRVVDLERLARAVVEAKSEDKKEEKTKKLEKFVQEIGSLSEGIAAGLAAAMIDRVQSETPGLLDPAILHGFRFYLHVHSLLLKRTQRHSNTLQSPGSPLSPRLFQLSRIEINLLACSLYVQRMIRCLFVACRSALGNLVCCTCVACPCWGSLLDQTHFSSCQFEHYEIWSPFFV